MSNYSRTVVSIGVFALLMSLFSTFTPGLPAFADDSSQKACSLTHSWPNTSQTETKCWHSGPITYRYALLTTLTEQEAAEAALSALRRALFSTFKPMLGPECTPFRGAASQ